MLPGPHGVVQPRQPEPTRCHLRAAPRPPAYRNYEYTATNTVPDRFDFTIVTVTDNGITKFCFIANDHNATPTVDRTTVTRTA
jgi:hypothetical protein